MCDAPKFDKIRVNQRSVFAERREDRFPFPGTQSPGSPNLCRPVGAHRWSQGLDRKELPSCLGHDSVFSLETGALVWMLANLLNWIACINCKMGWTSDRGKYVVFPCKKN